MQWLWRNGYLARRQVGDEVFEYQVKHGEGVEVKELPARFADGYGWAPGVGSNRSMKKAIGTLGE